MDFNVSLTPVGLHAAGSDHAYKAEHKCNRQTKPRVLNFLFHIFPHSFSKKSIFHIRPGEGPVSYTHLYHIRSGHGREIDREECYEILKRCEENGLVHEISNLDPPDGAAAICNCCGCSCFSLRIAQYFKTPDVIRSNYVAEVDTQKCVACGLCVENCNLGALKLGQKLCASPSHPPKYETPHEKLLWFGEKNYDADYRTDRGYVASDAVSYTHLDVYKRQG